MERIKNIFLTIKNKIKLKELNSKQPNQQTNQINKQINEKN
jgi:hypothetical protein